MHACLAVDVDPAATEGVDAAPAAGDVEEFEPADPLRQRGVDDEVVALRLEAEHRAQEEQRRALSTEIGYLSRQVRGMPKRSSAELSRSPSRLPTQSKPNTTA